MKWDVLTNVHVCVPGWNWSLVLKNALSFEEHLAKRNRKESREREKKKKKKIEAVV